MPGIGRMLLLLLLGAVASWIRLGEAHPLMDRCSHLTSATAVLEADHTVLQVVADSSLVRCLRAGPAGGSVLYLIGQPPQFKGGRCAFLATIVAVHVEDRLHIIPKERRTPLTYASLSNAAPCPALSTLGSYVPIYGISIEEFAAAMGFFSGLVDKSAGDDEALVEAMRGRLSELRECVRSLQQVSDRPQVLQVRRVRNSEEISIIVVGCRVDFELLIRPKSLDQGPSFELSAVSVVVH